MLGGEELAERGGDCRAGDGGRDDEVKLRGRLFILSRIPHHSCVYSSRQRSAFTSSSRRAAAAAVESYLSRTLLGLLPVSFLRRVSFLLMLG